MDFGTLKARCREILGRDVMPMAFDLAVSDLNDKLRIRGMEKTVTIASAGGTIALPSDLMRIIAIKSVAGGRLNPISYETLALCKSSGSPTAYVVGNGLAELNPAPDDGHEVKVVYYSEIAPLVNDGDTNAALTGALNAYVYTVLSQHSRLIRNFAAQQSYKAEADTAIVLANRADRTARNSGGTMSPVIKGTVV